MAKRYSQSKSPFRGAVAGGAAAAAAVFAARGIFALSGVGGFLLSAAVAALFGFLGYTFGSGLDTAQEAPRQKAQPITGDPFADEVIRRGQELLRAIRLENDRIPDPVLSHQMDELESVANKIFRQVAEQPGKAPQIRRFMDYYLPTTLKMLSGYRKIEQEKVEGRYADATKQKIEAAMDVVLSAFKKQLGTLFQNDMIDISTDIDVLETMLKQDALIENRQTMSAGGFAQARQMKEE